MTTATKRKFTNRLRNIDPALIGYFKAAKSIDMDMIERLDSVYQRVEEKVNAGVEFKDPSAFKDQCAELLTIAQQKPKAKNGEVLLKLAERLLELSQKIKGREPSQQWTAETESMQASLSVVEVKLKELSAKLDQYLSSGNVKPRKDREKIA